MIVFCEDCGQKNELTQKNMDNGRVVFTCQQCGYKNNYYLGSSSSSSDQAPIAKESSDFVGGFIYHKDCELIINMMPSALTRSDLNTLGSALYENLTAFLPFYTDTRQMTMNIPHRFTIVRPVDEVHIAVMIFTSPPSDLNILPVFDKLVTHLSKKVL